MIRAKLPVNPWLGGPKRFIPKVLLAAQHLLSYTEPSRSSDKQLVPSRREN
jgi:hypothetical protein